MVNPVDRPTAKRIRDALETFGAKGTVRFSASGWIARVRAGDQGHQRYNFPAPGEEAEWMHRMADHVEAATGIRIEFELQRKSWDSDEFHR